MLIFYPETLLNSYQQLQISQVNILKFKKYKIMSPAHRHSFIYLFPTQTFQRLLQGLQYTSKSIGIYFRIILNSNEFRDILSLQLYVLFTFPCIVAVMHFMCIDITNSIIWFYNITLYNLKEAERRRVSIYLQFIISAFLFFIPSFNCSLWFCLSSLAISLNQYSFYSPVSFVLLLSIHYNSTC